MLNIEQISEGNKGYFRAVEDGTEAGGMYYVWAGEKKMIIDHTEVLDAYKGMGVGKKLLMAVVAYARENNIRIVPLCPFAKSMFDRMPEIGDVLDR